MNILVIGLILGAALVHATWNAILHSDADRLWSITLMCMVSAVCALPFALWLPRPAAASWPYIAASATLQVLYCLTLVRAYRHGELSQIYPIARGSAPMMVTLGAAVFAAERLGPLALAGVAMVSAGVIALARGKGRPDPVSVGMALLTGLLIAAYTVVDGVGGRLSGHAVSYALWLSVCQGAPMPLVFMVLRGPIRVTPVSRAGLMTASGGVLAALGYGSVILALSLSPMGAVSALRETSILFAALIGRVFLKEKLTPPRAAAGAVIALGAICLALGA
jgi:drug/metabolite transporter (DMT)-like permease